MSSELAAKRRSTFRGYAVAFAAAVAILLVHLAADGDVLEEIPLMSFFAAVALAAWVGGLGPGLFATGVSALLSTYYLLQPQRSFDVWMGSDRTRLLLFVAVGALVSWLVEAMRSHRARAAASEQAAREQREAASRMLESIGDGVIATDTRGEVTFVNRTAERLTGWSYAEAVGRPLSEVFHVVDERGERVREADFEGAVRAGRSLTLPDAATLVARGGETRPISGVDSPVSSEKGEKTGVVLVFRDISAVRQAERERAERMRLAALDAEISKAVALESDLREMLRRCCECLVRHLDGAFARIWTYDAAEEMLELQASAGLYTHIDGGHSRIRLGELKIGRIARERAPHLTNDVAEDPRISDPGWARREGMVAFAGYPLLVGDRLMGVMAVFARHRLSESTLQAMEAVAYVIAVSIERWSVTHTLAASEERTRLLLESTGEGVYGIDLEGKCTFANHSCARLLGYRDASELLGRNMHELIHHSRPDGTPLAEASCRIYEALGRDEGLSVDDEVFWRADGSSFPVEYRSYPILRDGRRLGAVVTFVDITERTRAAESMRLRDRALQAISQGIFITDPERRDERFLYVNDAFEQLTGYGLEDVRGRDIAWLAGPAHAPEALAEVRTAFAETREASIELPLTRKDGTSFWATLAVAPVLDGSGRASHFVGVLTDVTERRRTLRRLSVQYAVAKVLTTDRPLMDTVIDLLEATGEALEWPVGAAWVLEPASRTLRCASTWTAPDRPAPSFLRETSQTRFQRGEGLPGRAWERDEAVWSVDVLQDPDFPRARSAAEDGLHGGIAFPIRGGRGFLGVLEYFSDRMQPPDDDLLRTLEALGSQIGQYVEREQAEEHLRRSEARKDAILQTALDCIVTMDHRGRVVEWNRAAESVFGYEREDVLGKELAELIIPPSLQDQHRKGLARYLQTGEHAVLDRRLELTAVGAHRDEFPVEVAITRIPTAGAPLFTGFIRDITEQKKAEKSVKRNEQRYRSLVEATAAIVWVTSASGEFEQPQPDWSTFTGLESAELMGWGWLDAVHPGDRRRTERSWKAAVSAQTAYETEHRLRRFDGQYRIMSVRAVPIRDADGVVAEWVGIHTDVTEQREAEEELHLAKESAEAASRAKSTFLANMSHELRTPLNAIIGYSEMLQEEAEDGDSATLLQDLDKIRTAGRHLLRLINDILDLSKIEAGKMTLHVETFDVLEMTRGVVETIEPLVLKNENTLRLDVEENLGTMRADLTKTRQSVLNLLSNASKFTKGGEITLRLRRESIDDRDWVVIQVEDTGIGMTAEQVGQLFQPFTQADASTTRKYGGTGLGLTISRRFCQMMGGELSVASEPGAGSTFTMRLPVRMVETVEEPMEPSPQPEAEPSPSRDQSLVLVIDDDPAVQDLIRRTLVPAGFRVASAPDGERGLRMARQLEPNAITLDIMMPGMDGWQVLSRLKARSETSDIPVILVTMLEDRSLGFALGAADYLTKPIDRRRLTTVLNKIRRSSPRTALVVDDDDVARDRIRRVLGREGWSVVCAEDGQAGLQELSVARPDVVVLDLMMPVMDGFDFLDALRKRESTTNLPVVIVTAKDLTEDERSRLSGRVAAVLEKGTFTQHQLLEEVQRVVSGHGKRSFEASVKEP